MDSCADCLTPSLGQSPHARGVRGTGTSGAEGGRGPGHTVLRKYKPRIKIRSNIRYTDADLQVMAIIKSQYGLKNRAETIRHALQLAYIYMEEAVTAGKPNIDPSILNPRREGYRHGTSLSIEPPENIERRPQGHTCWSCGKSKCSGHPKIES